MTASNRPTYSLLMWHRKQFSNKVDNVTQQKHSGLKLTDRCVKVCVFVCVHACVRVCA